MPDVYERPHCPPGCPGVLLGTCRIDRLEKGTHGHESLFPSRSVGELHTVRRIRAEFWAIVRKLRDMCADIAAFTMDASWNLLHPEFGQA